MNKKLAFENNFLAIKEAFDGNKRVPKKWDKQKLQLYQGYGGLKEISLNPDKPGQWAKSNEQFKEDVRKLKDLILTEYQTKAPKGEEMFTSLTNSVLTSFYTPPHLVRAMVEPLKNIFSNSGTIQILDPCTGTGNYITELKDILKNNDFEITGFEKERTAAWFAQKITEENIYNKPFESVTETVEGKKFDFITSNIPFGNVTVYDPLFFKSKDIAQKKSLKQIHSYFFTKGISHLNENGIIAFITASGVMDAPTNQYLREYLILNTKLITAERLPDSAFKDAGTTVCSDIIILQKREKPLTNIKEATEQEQAFVNSVKKEMGEHEFNVNEFYIKNPEKVHGNFEIGSFHGGKKILTVKSTEDYLNKLRSNIELSVSLNSKKPKLEPSLATYNIELVPISEKAFVFRGDTYQHRNYIKELGGIWNVRNSAWMFPLYKKETVTNKLLDYLIKQPLNLFVPLSQELQTQIPTSEPAQKKETVSKPTIKVEPVRDLFSLIEEGKPIAEERKTDEQPQEIKETKKPEREETVIKSISSLKLSQEFIDNNYLKEGNLFSIDNSIRRLIKDQDNEWSYEKLQFTGEKLRKAKGIIEIRKQYQILTHLENLKEPVTEIESQRTALNNVYDEFVEKFGNLNENSNKKIIERDSFCNEIKALEWEEHGEHLKSDIFFKSMHIDRLNELKIDNLQDAITYSLYSHGKVNITEISNLLNRSTDDIIKEGIDKKLLAINPIFPKDWNSVEANENFRLYLDTDFEITTWSEFTSGRIHDKIQALKNNDTFDLDSENKMQLISELENILPKSFSVKEINPNFGERWLNEKIYSTFISDLMGGDYSIKYLKGLDSYKISLEQFTPPLYEGLYNVKCINGRTIRSKEVIAHALSDTLPEITYKVNDITYTDHKAINQVESNINRIKQKFSEFIKYNPQFHSEIENTYFLTHLQHLKKDNTVNSLIFNDVETFLPRNHQIEAAWQIISNNGGIIDHKVGSGKTLVIAMSAITMKRMGIAKKPLVIALKANVPAIYQDIKKAYPRAKVLFPTKKNMQPENRKEFLLRMMNNDYDVIVMTHEQFEKIPLPPETTINVIKNELNNLEVDLDILNEDREPNKMQIKGLNIRKENLENKLKYTLDSIKKDNLPSFDKLGIDHIFVDESQQFKNLEYSTRHSRISGLGNQAGSKRALNLLCAIRYLQSLHGGDKGATFSSGTTISNSLTEMYLLLKYLRPNKLSELKMETFDAWAKTFAEKSKEYEITVTNEIKKRDRFRRFLKVPELSKLYNDIAHVITDSNLAIDKPQKNELLIKIPATEAQMEYSQRLIEFAQTGNPSVIGREFTHNQLFAKMLIATNEAKKMSIDMRLVNPNYTMSDGSKLFALCEKVDEYYRKYDHVKGTQLIFSDVGTPTTKGDLNIYDEIKNLLVNDYSIPEKEIAFVHDYNINEKKIEEFEEKVNSGEFRIAIGSTQTMGTGKNIQQRVVAGHHLDIPWMPKDYEQRNGRFERYGNKVAQEHCNNVVDTFCYATENSLDAYKFGLLATKANFIEQVKHSAVSTREIEEKSEDSITFGEFAAAINGKTELIEKIKKEKELQNLENLQATSKEQISNAEYSISIATKKIEKSNNEITQLDKDIEAYQSTFPTVKNPEEEFTITLKGGTILTGDTEIGKYIKERADESLKQNPYPDAEEVFRKGDYSVIINAHQDISGKIKNYMSVRSDITGNVYKNPHSTCELTTTPEPYGRLIRKSFDSMEMRKRASNREITNCEHNIRTHTKTIKDGFMDYSEKIDTLKNEISELEKFIENDGKTAKVGKGVGKNRKDFGVKM